jgi:hypothetical protein
MNFGVFPLTFWHMFCLCESLIYDFPFINQYFYKEPSFQEILRNIYLCLGYEFGLQRIRYLRP